ncbi:MAG TPA: hypothetical protein VK053_19265 [Jiangellaceae bacterium]|nr:hypothetical protein [Jiangellaceae bacterium]
MPRYTKPGHRTVETDSARTRVSLLAAGYTEQKPKRSTPKPEPASKPEPSKQDGSTSTS